ncbi:PRC and DUF2382 domain-containing protein [Arthrobacter sp. L77]|uniref:PRC and DUF2382 domain-containing protein n=1 Tax=Arthrobacter sp. L77 TaxID=1496689 RepID=UPI00068A2B3E|nr:PRC and DUF2382 domain-containing protein [Arthrobacter sp. L77]
MLTMHELDPLLGHRTAVVTDQGDRVGSIGEVYLNDATETPTWVTVHTGLFGTKESFVPLDGATVQDGRLVVAYPRDLIRHAPSIERDGHLSPEDKGVLYAHYGLDGPTADDDAAGDGAEGDPTAGQGAATRERQDDGGPWMIRSEERLRVRTETHAAARVRLRKYVVTEEARQTVPLLKEELLIGREPITTRTASVGESLFQEEVVELVGHEERAVILGRETVPVERVRLARTTVAGRATVRDEVRKERIVTSVDGETAADADAAFDARSRRSGGRARGKAAGTAGRRRAAPADDESGRIVTNSPNPLLKGRNKRR